MDRDVLRRGLPAQLPRGGLIDAAVARRLGAAPEDSPRWPGLCARFQTATRLEVDFWSMGLSG